MGFIKRNTSVPRALAWLALGMVGCAGASEPPAVDTAQAGGGTDVGLTTQAVSYGEHGFVFAPYETGHYYLTSPYVYNSEGGGTRIRWTSTGNYDVFFNNMVDGHGGNAQVVAYGDDTTRCKIRNWGGTGTGSDLRIRILCHDHNGNPKNTRFVASFDRKDGGFDGGGGYVWANEPTASSYTPNTTYSWNSAGGPVRITRQSEGRYRVTFEDQHNYVLGAGGRVTAYGAGSDYCTIAYIGQNADGLYWDIDCYDKNGNRDDARFSLNFFTEGQTGVYDVGASAWYPLLFGGLTSLNETGGCGSNNVEDDWLGNGRSTIWYQNQNATGSAAFSTSIGGPAYCKVVSWSSSAGGTKVKTRCFNHDGTPVDAPYIQTYITKHSLNPC